MCFCRMSMELKEVLLIRTFLTNKQLKYLQNELSDWYEIEYVCNRSIIYDCSSRVKIMIVHELSVQEIEKYVNLSFVQIYGRGIDKVCTDYLDEKGIYYCSCSGTEIMSAIGEYVLLQILSWERNFFWLNKTAHDGSWDWKRRKSCVYRSIRQLKVGIVGKGKIGMGVSEFLRLLGLKVFFINVGDRMEEGDKKIINKMDYISLHISLTANTVGCIEKEFFALMNKNAVLINTTRGAVVNEQDLVTAYNNGEIRGASLDVTVNEPLQENDCLRNCDGIIITPHISGRTEAALMENIKEIAKNILMEVWKQ